MNNERCPATCDGGSTPEGRLPVGRCGLPVGHTGPHTILSPTDAPWFSATERTSLPLPAEILSDERSTPDGPRDTSSCPSCLSLRTDLASLKAELQKAERTTTQVPCPPPAVYWRCFYCGYTAIEKDQAEQHFGGRFEVPACRVVAHPTFKALEAELVALKAERAWQPIETIPDDHDYRLLLSPAHGRVVGAHIVGDVWHLVGVGAVTSPSERPTYFVSLPPFPAHQSLTLPEDRSRLIEAAIAADDTNISTAGDPLPPPPASSAENGKSEETRG